MDVVEFAEKFYGVILKDWQKTYLRTLDRLYTEGDVRVVVVPKGVGRMFTYFKLKELTQNGKTSHRKQ
jgi:hypothetical protein